MTVNYCGRNNGPQRGTHSIWSGCPEGPGPDVSGTKTPQLLWKCDNTLPVWQLMREILTAVAACTTGLTYTRRPVWVTLQWRRRLFQELNSSPRPSRVEESRGTSKQTRLTSNGLVTTNNHDDKSTFSVCLKWCIIAACAALALPSD